MAGRGRGPLTWVTHAGVDPALPGYATKHIVLANQYGLYAALSFGLSSVVPTAHTLLPEVRFWILAGVAAGVVTILLNALRQSLLASAFLVVAVLVIFVGIGRLEPPETEHVGFIVMNAVIAWFVFPPTRRALALASTVVSALGVAFLFWSFDHTPPPAPLPGFDAVMIGRSNLVMLFIVLLFFCFRTVTEMGRVERELVEERKKTESLLKREVAHQVAERSREMGAALTRTGAITAASFASPHPFGERYRVVRSLGEGGMGAVFEVERLTDSQRLALKVMTGDVSREQAARFAREAEIGARVHDPHLVSIVDVGVAEGGAPFLVMELVTGGSLEMQRSKFGDAAWALPILRDVAAALAALHSAGVVHRDLKPGNVLLDAGGAAKVADFGIARLGVLLPGNVDVDAATQQAVAAGSALTGTGVFLGTPLYMAPEAGRGGREIGAKADIFAFGILAHELLTGRPVFATPPVLLALADQPMPAPPTLDAALPEKLRDALRACLAEEPSKRPDAVRLMLALEA